MDLFLRAQADNFIYIDTFWGQEMQVPPSVFNVDFLKQEALITGTNTGRSIVYFFNYQQHELVLRHYHRGGAMAKLTKDHFFWAGLKQTRVYKELAILSFLSAQGLPVPRPIAGRVCRQGIVYQADIITQVIPHSRELHQVLQSQKLSDLTWRLIGQTLAKMHKVGVCHYDINVKNILIDDKEQVFLIDFDKCEKRRGESWKAQNMARFRRSLDKQVKRLDTYHFQEKAWQVLMDAYRNE